MAEMTVELNQLMKLTNFELFDFEYTFDDLIFKKEIEQAIIDYYFFYEIGQETPDRFKHVFKTRFTRMINYYNKLHNTTLLTYNPLINYSINDALTQLGRSTTNQDGTTTSKDDTTNTQHSSASSISDGNTTDTNTTNVLGSGTNSNVQTNDTNTTNTDTSTSNTNDKASDYPQQAIGAGDFLQGERVGTGTTTSNATTKDTGTVSNAGTSSKNDTTTNTGTGTSKITGSSLGDLTNISAGTGSQINKNVVAGTTNSSYEKTIEGLTGTSYQELISKERTNLIRIKNMIINELKPCFYLVY